ncbi:unnamed protein product [Adineta ricciae]|uniref:G domain-containing protein n=1 Tax=Adineta ricciae TaxID=249248 RepID=A0A813Y1A1_ADIRI|nr:unnamed protein product [Adineta ricciae]CAF1353224.1 unnamed protein product [Adineta ricciae]
MIAVNIITCLSSHIVQELLNTINSFRDRHGASAENAQLNDLRSRNDDLTQENAVLRRELSKNQAKTETTTPQYGQGATLSQQSEKNSNASSSINVHHPSSTAEPSSDQMEVETERNTDDNAALRVEVAQYRDRHAQLIERYRKLNEELKRKRIKSFEDLAKHDQQALKTLIELAKLTEPLPMEGNNIGLFGLTSTGKSTMLNTLIGKTVAETGAGETTTTITPHKGSKFILWDIPGRNDEVSYFSMEYISFFKGLTRRLILIGSTVKENSSLMRLLDELGLKYTIVFNKFDLVKDAEQSKVKSKIESETKELGLKGVEKIYFVSAEIPDMFEDWKTMVNHLVGL